jgi:hypothetical protein
MSERKGLGPQTPRQAARLLAQEINQIVAISEKEFFQQSCNFLGDALSFSGSIRIVGIPGTSDAMTGFYIGKAEDHVMLALLWYADTQSGEALVGEDIPADYAKLLDKSLQQSQLLNTPPPANDNEPASPFI